MNLIHALVLGIVEGLTEFLPISSTAHLEITAALLKIGQNDFVKTFEIAIQFGAILAVVFIYARLLGNNWQIWKRIIVAFIPTALVGFVLFKFIKDTLLGDLSILPWTLGLGGVVLIVCEYFIHDPTGGDPDMELSRMSYPNAVFIGLAQALAVIPGVSRSATTIIAGRLLGFSRAAVVEFSFLLAIPTIAAASGYALLKSHSIPSGGIGLLVVGFIASFVSALLAVTFFIRIIRNRNLTSFGIYRILLAGVLIILLAKGIL